MKKWKNIFKTGFRRYLLVVKKEIDYYPEIATTLTNEISHSITDLGNFIVDFQACGNIDLAKGLELIAQRQELPISFCGISVEMVRELFVDITGCIYSNNSEKSALIICELKKKPLSLTDFAQLIGYCYTSSVPCGLLISIDNRISTSFEKILRNNPHLLNFKLSNKKFRIGICWWNSSSGELCFDQIGNISSITDLSRFIAHQLI